MSLNRTLSRSINGAPFEMTNDHVRAIREAIRERAHRLGMPEQTAFAIAFRVVVFEALKIGVTPSVLRANLDTFIASTVEQITGKVTP